ncbi:hypothetical protein Y1Q_0010705 [Alligator mississippiensis]|uniref:Reverse transcriptase RNase H-like domain-containing protein n=1 Tax=Alligator mississippiensis TaxID=8496 RepID=A0A151M6J8_ALLMI|nr:hypothetical protein Y1Q_0010705 [Alligator mississippiensis]
MENPDLVTYADVQAPAMGPVDIIGQNLQLLTQILGSQQLMLDQQQEWHQHSLASFKMPKMTKEDDQEAYIEAFERHALVAGLDKRYWASQTDASEMVVGAVLTQEEGGGGKRPVAYASRKLLPAEKRYATIERECLAIWWAVDYFRYYLIGREFTLVMDHAPLKFLSMAKSDNVRITRWALALQPYKFCVTYRPGKTNTVADFLSRCGNEDQAGDQKDPGKGWTDPTGISFNKLWAVDCQPLNKLDPAVKKLQWKPMEKIPQATSVIDVDHALLMPLIRSCSTASQTRILMKQAYVCKDPIKPPTSFSKGLGNQPEKVISLKTTVFIHPQTGINNHHTPFKW